MFVSNELFIFLKQLISMKFSLNIFLRILIDYRLITT